MKHVKAISTPKVAVSVDEVQYKHTVGPVKFVLDAYDIGKFSDPDNGNGNGNGND